MAHYEEDFILRQTKMMAKLLAKFVGKEEVEEIMKVDQETNDPDNELDQQIAAELEKFKKEQPENHDELETKSGN